MTVEYSIRSLSNLLKNKISDAIRVYYNNYPDGQPPDVRPIYVEAMTLQFGELAELAGVQETLRVLAVWTTATVHHAEPGCRRECVYQQVERQMAFFGTLFPLVVEALPG
jgi:hypothetical protein